MSTPKRKWNLQAKDQQGNDISAQISAEFEMLIRLTRLDEIAPGRVSFLLLASLLGGYKAGTINPSSVAREIDSLEKNEQTGLKPARRLRRPPLKNLWHKHYMRSDIGSLAENVQNALEKYGIPVVEQKIREAEEAGEARYFSAEDVPQIVNDVIHGNWQRRRQAQKLTGEWIVFAKHEGQNYYLTLATHDKSTHGMVRQQIDTYCCREFPFLGQLLAN